MNVVFFGTAEFAVPILRAVAASVRLVVSQPGRPSGRGMIARPSPVEEAACALSLPFEAPNRCRDPEFVERVRALQPDALVVAAYGQILSERLLAVAPRGGINLHGSVLPAYRGAAPIQRAILDGLTETGVTLMQMDRGMDTGDIIAVERLPIGPDETAGDLTDLMAARAADMAREWLLRIIAGGYPRHQQPEEGVSYAPKIEKGEARLDPARTAEAEYNRFRATTPRPGAFAHTSRGVLKVMRAALADLDGPPGSVLAVRPRLVVAFGDGSLALDEVCLAGKRPSTGAEFANGARLETGAPLVLSEL